MNVKDKLMDAGSVGTVAEHIGPAEIGIMVALLGWAATIFGFGRVYGTLSVRLKETETDIRELRKSIDRLLKCFVTMDGEPRLVSFVALDQIRASCQANLNAKIDTHEKTIEKHDEKLDKIIAGIAELAALTNSKNGGRQSL